MHNSNGSTQIFYVQGFNEALCGASGSQKSKMAALKEEELITEHLYNIASAI